MRVWSRLLPGPPCSGGVSGASEIGLPVGECPPVAPPDAWLAGRIGVAVFFALQRHPDASIYVGLDDLLFQRPVRTGLFKHFPRLF